MYRLIPGAEVRRDPEGHAEALVRAIQAHVAEDDRIERETGRRPPLHPFVVHKLRLGNHLTEEQRRSYLFPDGSVRPRGTDGYPIQGTAEEADAEWGRQFPAAMAARKASAARYRALAPERVEAARQTRPDTARTPE